MGTQYGETVGRSHRLVCSEDFSPHHINSGCTGMTSEDTAVPFPYPRLIVGTRHCRVLISGYVNSNATGFDMTRFYNSDATGFDINPRTKVLTTNLLY